MGSTAVVRSEKNTLYIQLKIIDLREEEIKAQKRMDKKEKSKNFF